MRLFKSTYSKKSLPVQFLSRRSLPLLAIAAALFLSACASAPKVPDVSLDGNNGATTDVTTEAEVVAVPNNSVSARAPVDRVVFFDFDSAQVRSEYRATVTDHGRFLAANPDGRVQLEGHTDERGTREYNIALGEGRAQNIRELLQLQGASPSQISIISFGEELPAASGQNEGAWAQNRRVVIVYSN